MMVRDGRDILGYFSLVDDMDSIIVFYLLFVKNVMFLNCIKL